MLLNLYVKNADKKPIIVSIGEYRFREDNYCDNLKYYNLQLENDDKDPCLLREPVDIWKTISDKNGETILEKFITIHKSFHLLFKLWLILQELLS